MMAVEYIVYAVPAAHFYRIDLIKGKMSGSPLYMSDRYAALI